MGNKSKEKKPKDATEQNKCVIPTLFEIGTSVKGKYDD